MICALISVMVLLVSARCAPAGEADEIVQGWVDAAESVDTLYFRADGVRIAPAGVHTIPGEPEQVWDKNDLELPRMVEFWVSRETGQERYRLTCTGQGPEGLFPDDYTLVREESRTRELSPGGGWSPYDRYKIMDGSARHDWELSPLRILLNHPHQGEPYFSLHQFTIVDGSEMEVGGAACRMMESPAAGGSRIWYEVAPPHRIRRIEQRHLVAKTRGHREIELQYDGRPRTDGQPPWAGVSLMEMTEFDSSGGLFGHVRPVRPRAVCCRRS